MHQNLLEFLEKITSLADKRDPVDVVCLDFARVFDKVPWKRLMAKLCAHGVSGSVFRWIRARLTDKKQRVVLNGKASSWRAVISGVPQESVHSWPGTVPNLY